MTITRVIIDPKEFEKIEKWQIVSQYHKAKWYIISWDFRSADFKKRQPYKEEIWYFRINKQYRAFGNIVDSTLRVFHVDDHSR